MITQSTLVIGGVLCILFTVWMEVKTARCKEDGPTDRKKRYTSRRVSKMKQRLKGGDCVSKFKPSGYLSRSSGLWKKVRQKMNKRFRKEGKLSLQSAEDNGGSYE